MGTAIQRVDNTNLKLAVGIQIRLGSLATCELQASTAAEKDSYQSIGRANAQNLFSEGTAKLQYQNGWDAISKALSMSRMSQTAQKDSINLSSYSDPISLYPWQRCLDFGASVLTGIKSKLLPMSSMQSTNKQNRLMLFGQLACCSKMCWHSLGGDTKTTSCAESPLC